jgi:hypothetical protein
VPLRAPEADPEPRHDFIEYQESPILTRDLSEPIQKSGRRKDESRIPQHGFQDDSRELVPFLAK